MATTTFIIKAWYDSMMVFTRYHFYCCNVNSTDKTGMTKSVSKSGCGVATYFTVGAAISYCACSKCMAKVAHKFLPFLVQRKIENQLIIALRTCLRDSVSDKTCYIGKSIHSICNSSTSCRRCTLFIMRSPYSHLCTTAKRYQDRSTADNTRLII